MSEQKKEYEIHLLRKRRTWKLKHGLGHIHYTQEMFKCTGTIYIVLKVNHTPGWLRRIVFCVAKRYANEGFGFPSNGC